LYVWQAADILLFDYVHPFGLPRSSFEIPPSLKSNARNQLYQISQARTSLESQVCWLLFRSPVSAPGQRAFFLSCFQMLRLYRRFWAKGVTPFLKESVFNTLQATLKLQVCSDDILNRLFLLTFPWNAASLRRTELLKKLTDRNPDAILTENDMLQLVNDLLDCMGWFNKTDVISRTKLAEVFAKSSFTLKDCKALVPVFAKLDPIFANLKTKQMFCILSICMNYPLPLEFIPIYAELCPTLPYHVLHFLNLFDATQSDIPFHDKLMVSKLVLSDRFGPVKGSIYASILEQALVVQKGDIDNINIGFLWRSLLNLDTQMRGDGGSVKISTQGLPSAFGELRKTLSVDLLLLRFMYQLSIDADEVYNNLVHAEGPETKAIQNLITDAMQKLFSLFPRPPSLFLVLFLILSLFL
jgi:hypothetical protein